MNTHREYFADGKYFAEVQYRASAEYVCGLKLSIVVRDVVRDVNVCLFDDSHEFSSGIWPFHRHLEKGRHFLWASNMESAGPKTLFVEAIAFVLKEVKAHHLMEEEDIPDLAKALTLIWLVVQLRPRWRQSRADDVEPGSTMA